MVLANDQWCPAFASWCTAVLRGRVAIDDAVDALTEGLQDVTVIGLTDEPEPVQLAWTFGRLRKLGVTGTCALWAAPGHPAGLPGPPDFNARAIARSGAVVTLDGPPLGILPDITTVGPDDDYLVRLEWHVEQVQRHARPFASSLAEAERNMVNALHQGLTALEQLDVAQWRDDVLDVMRSWDDDEVLLAPPGLPDRAYRLIAQTERLMGVVDLALADEGGAVSASEAAVRQAALSRLVPAIRDASTAAWNSGLAVSSVSQ